MSSTIHNNSTSISNNDIDNSRSNVVQNALQYKQHIFSSDYNGPIFILIECINIDKNLGKWHPFKAAKFFSTNFTGITNIKPAGFKKIKITFDFTTNGNLCLKSTFFSQKWFFCLYSL
uniref:Uncharacterized protein n=1 Tax=Sipha flava TaxID=143950 RepID=A0A2S2R988_9HEMI